MNLKEELTEHLETMCRRCENHAECGGTGCEPKKQLAKAIEYSSLADKKFREWAKLLP